MSAQSQKESPRVHCRRRLSFTTRFIGQSEFLVLESVWRGDPVDEFAFRDPDIWLSEAMVERVAGLPVIMEHPPIGVLNSHEFAQRAIGTCLFGFVRDKDLWAVARILDRQANELMLEGLDTSPGVHFSPGAGARIPIDDKSLLVEGDPCLLDHIAICEKGRWTRDGPPGIENSEDTNVNDSAYEPIRKLEHVA